ncbi:MAG TPA: hypothetical protein IAC04_05490 [Candidatus Coprenecus stercoravium]|uniref:Uncharacterized protein n=1 Tax=Candidatus Coprenecus stercoravium TaxID=2840735 RepID=A0A9D2GPJ3_9BACT|nr:hypothetical protein [Candidatus Coprenecus stercoravium]
MANLFNEEIQRILIEVESSDVPDFTEQAKEAAKEVSELRDAVTRMESAMASLAAQGKKNSDEFIELQLHSEDLTKRMKALIKEQKGYSNALDVSQLSSNQLRERSKMLRKALDDTIQSADTETWDRLNDEYIKVTRRMGEVRAGTMRVADSMDITQMSAKQLETYAKQLADRMDDIPGAAGNPDWQKLNVRLQEVKERMGDVEESTKDTNAKWATMWGNLWTNVVTKGAAGLKRLSQDIVSTSNVIGDRWNRFTTGMRKGYEAFLTTLASGDWSGLWNNIEKAVREGRELAKLQEDVFEMQNASSLTETRNNIEISRQTAVMRDTTKSNKERIAAAEKILELENQILSVRKKTAERERVVALKAINDKTNGALSSEDMEYIVDNYFNNAEMLDAAGDYLELEEELKKARRALKIARVTAPSLQVLATYEGNVSRLENEMKKMLDEVDGLDKIVELQREYDLLNDEDILAYVDAQTGYLKARADFEQATLRTKTMLAKLREELKTEEYEKEAAKVEEWAAQERIAVKQRAADRQMTEEEMSAELERIETERLRRVSEVNKKFGVDILESTEAVLDDMISSMDGFTQAAADGSEEALDGALEKARSVNKTMEEITAESTKIIDGLVTEDVDEGRRQQLEEDRQTAGELTSRYADKRTRLEGLAVDKDAELAHLKSMYDEGLLSEETYQKARVDIIRKYSAQARNIQSEGWEENLQMASVVLNNMASLVSSIQEAQTASLEAQMQKELAAAGSNADKRAAIEEKYEAKKLELQKKYANINMGIQIAQALTSGALAMVQAWNAAGANPVLAGIIMGMIAATTAAQVATIIAQRNAIMNTSATGSSESASVRTVTSGSGYSEGGFTGYGGRLEPAGIVHRGEYVVPVPEMRDPEAYSHVMAIERIRSRRSRRNPLPGFADGGYAGSASGADAVLDGVMSELRALRKNPVKAYVVLSELNLQQSLRNTHLKAGSRS